MATRSSKRNSHEIVSPEINRLKVDVLAIAAGGLTSRILTTININVPISFIKNEEDRLRLLERIYTYIEVEFNEYDNLNVRKRKNLTSDIQVEITATYTLRNLVTDEVKHWTGSFNPSANDMGSLMSFASMTQFQDKQDFVSHANNIIDPSIALRLLTWKGGNTKFKVEELKSVIFNFQCSLPIHHRFLLRRNVGGNSRNIHVSYDLP